ncbi:MAG: hypothetical protein AAGC46_14615, partial [Solirubrobacteraceae bacterium]
MSLRRLAAVLVALVAVIGAASGLAAPSRAFAEAAGTPAGSGAVGGSLDLAAAHGCALQADRTVRCWGDGAQGRLGGASTADALATPGSAA